MASPFANKLKALARGDGWSKAAESAAKPFENMPAGKYMCTVVGAELCEAGTDGHLQIKWTYRVEEGDHQNENIYEYMDMSEMDRLKWYFIRMNKFGIDAASIGPEKTEELLEELVAAKYSVRVVVREVPSKKEPGTMSSFASVDRVFRGGEGDEITESS